MGSFVFQSTEIEGLRLVAPMFHRDRRGYFSKTFEREAFQRMLGDIEAGKSTASW